MGIPRTDRLNSLLKEILAEVIVQEVRNPKISEFHSITRVNISKDLRHAKVYVSVIGDENQKKETLRELNKASGFIGTVASKKVTTRFFPSLKFLLDDSVEEHIHIEELLGEINAERKNRPNGPETEE